MAEVKSTRFNALRENYRTLPIVLVSGIVVALLCLFSVQNSVIGTQGGLFGANPLSNMARSYTDEGLVILGEYTVSTASLDEESTRMTRRAFDLLSGITIESGQTLSFNANVTDAMLEEGYQFGSHAEENEPQLSVCRVASALYSAALLADCDVVERYNHSQAVDFAPIGLDAKVAPSEADLIILNSNEFPIILMAKVSGSSITLQVLGTSGDVNLGIEVVSNIVSNTGGAEGEGEGSEPAVSNEYAVDSYRIYYRDGVEVERVLISKSIYLAS